MKRVLLGALTLLLSLTFASTAAASNLNQFTITRHDIDYELSRDSDGRSRLNTIETITAKFPDYDQNHGIERAVPKSYDGHSTSLSVRSVTDVKGNSLEYSTYSQNDNEVIRIGDPDEYVRGVQTYIIRYDQRDVTKAYADTKSDEFYWDTNGTEWAVPIDRLEVRLTVDDSLAQYLSGDTACYQGNSGSTNQCDLKSEGAAYETTAFNLSPGQNVTLAIGFAPDTFAKYEPSLFEKLFQVWIRVTIALGIVGFIITVFLTMRWYAWTNRKGDIGTIVPEYLPPKDTSLAAAASVLPNKSGSLFAAQLLDFAVRGYIQILQTREKSFWKSAEYTIEIIKNISGMKPEEKEILNDVFEGTTTVGSKLPLKHLTNNPAIHSSTLDNDHKLAELTRGEYGLRSIDPAKPGWFKRVGFILLAFAVLTLNPVLLATALFAFAYGLTLWPLTDKGVELSRYLQGMKMYIGVAEAERLKMLQSPEGALKIDNADVNDPAKLVKLYEKMLPYAVLFGQEKQWSKRIGELYESNGASPTWYTGNGALFNAALFSTAMSGFSSAGSYTSPSSSSSGGSGGGGFSGGGGGGGGGGGW